MTEREREEFIYKVAGDFVTNYNKENDGKDRKIVAMDMLGTCSGAMAIMLTLGFSRRTIKILLMSILKDITS